MNFRPASRVFQTAAVVFVLLTGGASVAQAQTNPAPDLIGKTFTPPSSVVLYSTPENGLITRQRAKVLVAPQNGAVTVYPLTKQGGDYVTGKAEVSPSLTIQQHRTIVQGKEVTQWLKVTGGGSEGWIKYDPSVTGPLPVQP